MKHLNNIWNLFTEPIWLERIHGGFVIFWIIVWILGAIFGWLASVTFVSHLSIIALVLASWSAWQAARTEVRQKEFEEQNGKDASEG